MDGEAVPPPIKGTMKAAVLHAPRDARVPVAIPGRRWSGRPGGTGNGAWVAGATAAGSRWSGRLSGAGDPGTALVWTAGHEWTRLRRSRTLKRLPPISTSRWRLAGGALSALQGALASQSDCFSLIFIHISWPSRRAGWDIHRSAASRAGSGAASDGLSWWCMRGRPEIWPTERL